MMTARLEQLFKAILIFILPLISIEAGAQNVGIGTNSPEYKLDIRGSNPDDGILFSVGNSDISHRLLLFGGRTGDVNPFIGWKADGRLRFITDEGGFRELMNIQGNGNVGIGVDTPQYRLDIRGDGASFSLGNNPGMHRLQLFGGSDGDPNPFIMVKATDPLRFATDNNGFTETMRITPGGNIGIGTMQPMQKLQVAGTVRATAYQLDDEEYLSPGPKEMIEFSNIGTSDWVCPSDVHKIMVEVWGAAGGGGGGGAVGTGVCSPGGQVGGSSGGGGGGGGAYLRGMLSVTPGLTYTIVIGKGGFAGPVNSSGGNGLPTQLKQGANILINVTGGGGGVKGVASYGSCPTISGGSGGIGGGPTGNFLKRTGRIGTTGQASSTVTINSSCACGAWGGATASGGSSFTGTVGLPDETIAQGGRGGKGAVNNSGQTAGEAGGNGYVMITTY